MVTGLIGHVDTSAGYTLQGLADASRIPVRTLRYYLAQGLLPAPARQGRLTRYPDNTLRRLAFLKRLRAASTPLAEIRDRLAAMTDAEVEAALGPPGMAKQLELRAGLDFPSVYMVRPPPADESWLGAREPPPPGRRMAHAVAP